MGYSELATKRARCTFNSPGAPMTLTIRICLLVLSLTVSTGTAAIEKPDYQLVETFGEVEIRQYPPLLVARTWVEASFGDAGNLGFRRLGGYIFGDNADDQRIAMTAPVTQSIEDGGYWVSFFMPAEFEMDNLPDPTDPSVEHHTQPASQVAVISYSGSWRVSRFEEHLRILLADIEKQGNWRVAGDPVWARYNAPFVPPFLRTNEIMIPVERLE